MLIKKVIDLRKVMIEFFLPILEHFCPLFLQTAQMGLIVPR